MPGRERGGGANEQVALELRPEPPPGHVRRWRPRMANFQLNSGSLCCTQSQRGVAHNPGYTPLNGLPRACTPRRSPSNLPRFEALRMGPAMRVLPGCGLLPRPQWHVLDREGPLGARLSALRRPGPGHETVRAVAARRGPARGRLTTMGCLRRCTPRAFHRPATSAPGPGLTPTGAHPTACRTRLDHRSGISGAALGAGRGGPGGRPTCRSAARGLRPDQGQRRKQVASVAVAPKILTLCFYGLLDSEICCLQPRARTGTADRLRRGGGDARRR